MNGSSGIVLVSWTASTDNVGVTGYQLSIDAGTLIDVGTSLSYSLNTASLANGSHTLSLTAKDAAGNKSSPAGIPITVNNTLYTFNGFFAPVASAPNLNTVKAGQAIPIKFNLGAEQSLDVLAAGYPQVASITCVNIGNTSFVNGDDAVSNSTLRYDATANQYIFTWKTDKTWTGSCKQFILKLKDGQVKTANFNFTR